MQFTVMYEGWTEIFARNVPLDALTSLPEDMVETLRCKLR